MYNARPRRHARRRRVSRAPRFARVAPRHVASRYVRNVRRRRMRSVGWRMRRDARRRSSWRERLYRAVVGSIHAGRGRTTVRHEAPGRRTWTDVLWRWRRRQGRTVCLMISNLAKPIGHDRIRRLELQCPLVCVDSVRHLVVARLVESSKVEPDLAEVRVYPDRPRIRIECIVKLINVVVQHTDRTPERWVLAVPINSLLISFVSLAIVVCRHESTSEQVPREWIVRVCGRLNQHMFSQRS